MTVMERPQQDQGETPAEQAGVTRLYQERFSPQDVARKSAVWTVLCRHFFQRYVQSGDTVLDLGAGHCDFINLIDCAHRIAVDQNPEVRRWARENVRVVLEPSTDMRSIESGSVDVVFASNVFEHLPTKRALLDTLLECQRVLRSNGRLLVLQPNIAAVGGRYWDFVDHTLPLTEKAVVEGLRMVGLDPVEARARFLPYTTKSALPQHPLLVRLYLMARPLHRVLGGQAWIVGTKR